jgi:hypothetical protein
MSATVSTCIVSSADDGGRSPYLTGPTGWSAQDPRASFFAFLAARFSFRLADDAFLIFFPPFSFDPIRGLLTDCGQPGRAAPIVCRGRLQRQQRHYRSSRYAMEFVGDKLRHMTKSWNDGHALKQLGWA